MVDGLERRAPRREGHRAGDPGRQDLRGGHRRRHHRRQRAVPGLQHLARGGAAVPEAGRPGAARRLPRRHAVHRGRAPATSAEQYKSPDGKYYQMPVEVQPGDDLLQQGPVQEGRHRPGEPAAGDVRRVPRDQRARSCRQRRRARPRSGRRRPASSSSPGSTSTRCTPPRPAARSWSRTARPRSTTPEGKAVAELLEDDVRREAARRRRSTTVTRSPTARPPWRSSARGPSRSTATRSTGASSRCRPPTASRPSQIHTFSDAKNVAIYSACKNQGTAWDVLKFATSKEQDGTAARDDRPDADAQGPDDGLPRLLRRRTRDYKQFADQAARTVEVPNVPNSIEIWQTFRDAYSKSVIFGETEVDDALADGRGRDRRPRRPSSDADMPP